MEHICDICNKKLKYNSLLIRHQKSHQKDKLKKKYDAIVKEKNEELREKDDDLKEKEKEINELKCEIVELKREKNNIYQRNHRVKKKADVGNTFVHHNNIFNIYTSINISALNKILKTIEFNSSQVNIYYNFTNFNYINNNNIPIDDLTHIHNLLYNDRDDKDFTASYIISKVCEYIFTNFYKNQFDSMKLVNKTFKNIMIFQNGEWKTYKFADIRDNLYNKSFKQIAFFCVDEIDYNKELATSIKAEWEAFNTKELSYKIHNIISKNSEKV